MLKSNQIYIWDTQTENQKNYKTLFFRILSKNGTDDCRSQEERLIAAGIRLGQVLEEIYG
ncbi:hypothetical protein MM239_16230 [Belliella sp. DSM 111904]|uniref:Uncharacterized protein n=1 Tax=Belliella filtrata TaxID=2923435 RepID=A0ABS9V3H7_9BACT|nr:hypothetical protein [Belliella filtrata]MCH7410958.1 hypothetical protein [Belliella filtrata]